MHYKRTVSEKRCRQEEVRRTRLGKYISMARMPTSVGRGMSWDMGSTRETGWGRVGATMMDDWDLGNERLGGWRVFYSSNDNKDSGVNAKNYTRNGTICEP